MDKAAEKRRERAERARTLVRDRRRFKIATPATGLPSKPAPPDVSATLFPSTVKTPEIGDAVLTDGINQVKLGGDVLVGDFKGYALYGLTLEERATCPRTCHHWRTCYGNGMPFSTRWAAGKEFEAALWADIEDRVRERGLLVRLHVLGDFYSWRYLCLWAKMLDTFPNLAAFGFTAWRPGTKIGDGVAKLRSVYPQRFAIRHSDVTGKWGSATIDFPTEQKKVGDMIVCPEQMDANSDNPRGKHCGNCAACWQSDVGVLFIQHGNTRRGRSKTVD